MAADNWGRPISPISPSLSLVKSRDLPHTGCKAIVSKIWRKPGCFIAGADISMLQKCKTKTAEETFKLSKACQDLLLEVEHIYTTVLRLPEVLLDLLPGVGATLDMILTVKSVKADKAKKLGLVDLAVQPLGPGLDKPDHHTLQHLEKGAVQTAENFASAVFEDLALKHCIVKEVEAIIPGHCIFATNMGALPITKNCGSQQEARKGNQIPTILNTQCVISMHYFSPVDKMQSLEIITNRKTSRNRIASAVDVGLPQGKAVIKSKRWSWFLHFACFCWKESNHENLTTGQTGPNPKFWFGPVTLTDEVGMDVGSHIGEYLLKWFGELFAEANPEFLNSLVQAGITGRKSGKSFFVYKKGFKGKKPVLEGDIGAVFGLGFPPFIGGPFRFVDEFGFDKLVTIMRKFDAAYGKCFTPDQSCYWIAARATKNFTSVLRDLRSVCFG
ncbi:hypothetical protein GHT06_011414 [Daphnia sinensis]|uniref:Uncharacterized protein n=1 Tax=Daphnia sinensis TaxID=1820382 RepID=A0AAD5KWM2_9CRUS|nr:hypothetical protein GHT06_011414 [Daphnia sinensis]